MKLRKFGNRLILSTTLLLGLVVFVTYLSVAHYQNPKSENFVEQRFFCGTVGRNLNENQEKGRQIFNSNCAACHKLQFRATGSALAKVDSITYWKILNNSIKNIDTTQFKYYREDYHQDLTKNIKKSDIQNIYSYLSAD